MAEAPAAQQRRAQIVAAARELFEKNGVDGTQVSQIVRKVGVAQGLFYYYFSSKEEVVLCVVEQVLAELEAQFAAIKQDKSASFYQKLRAFIDLYLQTGERFAGEAPRLKLPQDLQSNPVAQKATAHVLAHLKQIMDMGVEKGYIRLAHADATMRMIFYGLHRLRQQEDLPRQTLLELVEQGLHIPLGTLSTAQPTPITKS